ncbi:MAG: glycosyltransferase family 2 protein [Lysobacterales bacterium]
MRIAVVVVNYHTGAVLGDCLRRALANPEVAELALVDNGSVEGEIDQLLAELQDRRVLRLDMPHNPGFAVSCNRGARMTHSPWLLFLNPDCLLEADSLGRLAQTAIARPALGALGAALIDDRGQVDPASLRRDPLPARAIASALHLDRWVEGVAQPLPDNSAPVLAEAISGALMLVRREVYAATRGFDEGYFMHGEDLDLCRRIRELGYEVWMDPAVRVLHLKGVSTRRRPLRVMLAKHRGLLRYFDKFDAPRTAWPLRWAIRLGAYARLLIGLGLGLLRRP